MVVKGQIADMVCVEGGCLQIETEADGCLTVKMADSSLNVFSIQLSVD